MKKRSIEIGTEAQGLVGLEVFDDDSVVIHGKGFFIALTKSEFLRLISFGEFAYGKSYKK